MTVPTLAGINHLKLPVRDLRRSAQWYAEALGYPGHARRAAGLSGQIVGT